MTTISFVFVSLLFLHLNRHHIFSSIMSMELQKFFKTHQNVIHVQAFRSLDMIGFVALQFIPITIISLFSTVYFVSVFKHDTKLRKIEKERRRIIFIPTFVLSVFICIISCLNIWYMFDVFDKMTSTFQELTCEESCELENTLITPMYAIFIKIVHLRPLFITIASVVSLLPVLSFLTKKVIYVFLSSICLYILAVIVCLISLAQWIFCGFNEMYMCTNCTQYKTHTHNICQLPSYDLVLYILTIFAISLLQFKKRQNASHKTNVSEIELPDNIQYTYRIRTPYVPTTFDKWFTTNN